MSAVASLNNSAFPNPIDKTMQEYIVDLIITLTGNYPANGDTLNLAGLEGIHSNQVPNKVEIFEATPAPGPASGYAFVYLPGTNLSNGILEAFNGTTQFAAGAYGTPPFTIAGFVLRARAWIPVGV